MKNNNRTFHCLLLGLVLVLAGGCASVLKQSKTQSNDAATDAGAGAVPGQDVDVSYLEAADAMAPLDPLFSVPDPDQPATPDASDAADPSAQPESVFNVNTATSAGPLQDHMLQSILASFSPPLVPETADVPGPSDDNADQGDEDAAAPPSDDGEDATADNLWTRIRAGMKLPDYSRRRIDMEIRWFAEHQAFLDRVTERAKYYLYFIVDEVQRRHMPTEIALLPVVESAYQPFAYSHGRAAGIWQFIPSTARLYGLKRNWWYDGRRDVVASTRAALDYLQQLHDQFNGDWLLALAAYNSGEGTVQSAIRHNERRGRPTDFWSLRLPAETRGYVPRLLAIAKIVADPTQYGVSLSPIPDKPYFATVNTGSQVDLALVSKLTDLPMNEIYRLNPGFNRWATAPKGPFRVLVPVDKADDFRQGLAEIKPQDRIHWARHRVHRGETLGYIALRYHTTVAMIKQVNNIRGNLIRAGHYLTVPVATERLSRYTLSAEQRHLAIQNTPKGANKIVHEVVAGDTLWDLARAYHVNVRTLAAWNGMAPTDTLHPGHRLVIWTNNGSLLGSLKKSMAAAPDSDMATRRITYRVRHGDSLARISHRFNVSITNLLRWNDLDYHHYLQPGQKLTLFVDVTELGDNI